MAGHSHWKQIKHHKGTADKKRGQLFSKLLNSVAVAAKKETNPKFNPRLKTAIEKAKEYQVPQENIERAIKKSLEKNNDLEEPIFEAYGPKGIAIIIETITDSRLRTLMELKQVFKEHETKLAEPGNVLWAFNPPKEPGGEWKPKFEESLNDEDGQKLKNLVEDLEKLDDVQKIYTNAK